MPTISCAMPASADRPRDRMGRAGAAAARRAVLARARDCRASPRSPAEWRGDGGVVPIVFYRALVQSGNTAPVDALVQALAARAAAAAAGLRAQPQGGRGRRAARRQPSRRIRRR